MKDIDETLDQIVTILRKKSIDGYELFLDRSSHFHIESKEGKVDTFQVSRSGGISLRILKCQRMGFSYSTSLSSVQSDGWEKMIEDAIASAEATSTDPCFEFTPALRDPLPALPIFDGTLESVSEKRKIKKAVLLEEATRAADPSRIKKVRKASYQEVQSLTTLINSNHLRFSYPSTLISVSVTAVAEESGASEMGWDFDFSHFFDDLDVDQVGRMAGSRALERLGGKRISSGVYPVILRNHVASEFLSLLAHSFLSEQVQKGKSNLRGKKGQKLFSPLVSIMDDGLHPKGASVSPIDGEGTPSQRTSLVVQGEVSGYLYDRYWANRENLSSPSKVGSTGNSKRSSIKFPPTLGLSNFFIEPGRVAFPALVAGMDQGVILEEVMGLHMVDPISGDFSLGCSGDWIAGGRKAHPVKSIAVAGNLFELFQKVVGVGDDLRFFDGVGSPSLLVEGLQISGE